MRICSPRLRTTQLIVKSRVYRSKKSQLRNRCRMPKQGGCISDRVAVKLGGMPTAVRVGMFDQKTRIRVARRFLIRQDAWCHQT